MVVVVEEMEVEDNGGGCNIRGGGGERTGDEEVENWKTWKGRRWNRRIMGMEVEVKEEEEEW